jgi:hypothetical protein
VPLAQGKARMLQLESIRKDTITFEDIMRLRDDTYAWYRSI